MNAFHFSVSALVTGCFSLLFLHRLEAVFEELVNPLMQLYAYA